MMNSALFTVSAIKMDKLGRPYMTMYSKDGGKLFKMDGLGAAMVLSSVVGDDGEPISKGDLISVNFHDFRDASWNGIQQYSFVGVNSARIVARKGAGIIAKTEGGMTASSNGGFQAIAK